MHYVISIVKIINIIEYIPAYFIKIKKYCMHLFGACMQF
jgi:hypothetical protein